MHKSNASRRRSLSPHITIYKPQISSVLSIFHRITEFILYISFISMIWWIVFFTFSGFNIKYIKLFDYKIIKLISLISSYCLFCHLCTGIRHLIWDFGKLFSIKEIDISEIVAIIASVIFTIIFWLYICYI